MNPVGENPFCFIKKNITQTVEELVIMNRGRGDQRVSYANLAHAQSPLLFVFLDTTPCGGNMHANGDACLKPKRGERETRAIP